MLTTLDVIEISANPDLVFRAAADIEHWPTILPHYLHVIEREQGYDGRVVEMAARNGPMSLRWTALQILHITQWVIFYRHLTGPTRGMEVTWALEPTADGVRVNLTHQYSLEQPLLRMLPSAWIISACAVTPVAQQTLSHLKRYCEEGASCVVP